MDPFLRQAAHCPQGSELSGSPSTEPLGAEVGNAGLTFPSWVIPAGRRGGPGKQVPGEGAHSLLPQPLSLPWTPPRRRGQGRLCSGPGPGPAESLQEDKLTGAPGPEVGELTWRVSGAAWGRDSRLPSAHPHPPLAQHPSCPQQLGPMGHLTQGRLTSSRSLLPWWAWASSHNGVPGAA